MAEVKDNSSIQLFEDQKIRTAWDAEKEEWYFSIIDVISVLTGTANPRRYWSDLKRKLKTEGANELYEKIVQLKMLSSDGKRYKTDVANTEQLLRIIQSIPSPKAEPFKAWLAMVGKERIEETIDPEQAIDRALDTYLKKGYSEEWIHQRLLAIRIRNELTDEWKKRGVQKGREYAILTDEIPLDDALLQLREFIDENSGEFFVQVWGNGANFENTILRRSYERQGIPCPWRYTNDRDVRTIVALGLVMDFDARSVITFEGERHNALHDARYQAKYVSAIWQKLIPSQADF